MVQELCSHISTWRSAARGLRDAYFNIASDQEQVWGIAGSLVPCVSVARVPSFLEMRAAS